MFIKGNVKLCSGNRSFCRSIPKVKPLNQCGVIHPKPLLSCWKRNGNCTSKGRGQPHGEGSSGMDLGSAPGGLPRARLPTRARLGSSPGDAPFCSVSFTGPSAHRCDGGDVATWDDNDGDDDDVHTLVRGRPRSGCQAGTAAPSLSLPQKRHHALPKTRGCHRLGAEPLPTPAVSPQGPLAVQELRGEVATKPPTWQSARGSLHKPCSSTARL